MALLELDEVGVVFQTARGPLRAAEGVTLALEEKTVLGLLGESGCGKSVLAHAILGLLPENAHVSGRVLYRGRDLLRLDESARAGIRGREIALMLQNPALALNPTYTVGAQIAEVFRIHTDLGRGRIAERVADLLGRMGFAEPTRIARSYPFQMSGGMNQRAMIAAAVALDPPLVLADEPTKGLDQHLREEIAAELQRLNRDQNVAMLLITHDLPAAARLADRIALMYAGEIVEIAAAGAFFREPRHPYAQALLRSLPEHGFQAIPGMAPYLGDLPEGCRFAPRCALREEFCIRAKPALYHTSAGQVRCFRYR